MGTLFLVPGGLGDEVNQIFALPFPLPLEPASCLESKNTTPTSVQRDQHFVWLDIPPDRIQVMCVG